MTQMIGSANVGRGRAARSECISDDPNNRGKLILSVLWLCAFLLTVSFAFLASSPLRIKPVTAPGWAEGKGPNHGSEIVLIVTGREALELKVGMPVEVRAINGRETIGRLGRVKSISEASGLPLPQSRETVKHVTAVMLRPLELELGDGQKPVAVIGSFPTRNDTLLNIVQRTFKDQAAAP